MNEGDTGIRERQAVCLPKEEVPLAKLTTWGVGGAAEWFATVGGVEEVQAALAFARKQGLAVTVLGGGTNALISDEGLPGLVLRIRTAKPAMKRDGNLVTAPAGTLTAALAKKTVGWGLKGLEWACGVPGTLGGAVVMNAGAHGGQFSDVVRGVTVVTEVGALQTLAAEAIGYSYRTSHFPTGSVVIEAELELTPGDPKALSEAFQKFLAHRAKTQPLGARSAGSVFRNPPGDYAGRLIESCGLKGFVIGGAQISEVHANFIVNGGTATAEDIAALICHVQEGVFERTGVLLETEVRFLGRFSRRPRELSL